MVRHSYKHKINSLRYMDNDDFLRHGLIIEMDKAMRNKQYIRSCLLQLESLPRIQIIADSSCK